MSEYIKLTDSNENVAYAEAEYTTIKSDGGPYGPLKAHGSVLDYYPKSEKVILISVWQFESLETVESRDLPKCVQERFGCTAWEELRDEVENLLIDGEVEVVEDSDHPVVKIVGNGEDPVLTVTDTRMLKSMDLQIRMVGPSGDVHIEHAEVSE